MENKNYKINVKKDNKINKNMVILNLRERDLNYKKKKIKEISNKYYLAKGAYRSQEFIINSANRIKQKVWNIKVSII